MLQLPLPFGQESRDAEPGLLSVTEWVTRRWLAAIFFFKSWESLASLPSSFHSSVPSCDVLLYYFQIL